MTKKTLLLFFLISIVLLFRTDVIGQEPFYWQLTEEDGLPSMTIYQVHQDKKGFIWFGTENGICRYDGKKMETYNHSDLLDNEILTIQEDSWGRIWFRNLAGQIAYWEDDEITISIHKKEDKLFEFLIVDSVLFTYSRNTDKLGSHLLHFRRYDISEKGLLNFVFRFNTKGTNGIRRLSVNNGKIYGLHFHFNSYSSIYEFDLRVQEPKEYKIVWNSINEMPVDFSISSKGLVSIVRSDEIIEFYNLENDTIIYQPEYKDEVGINTFSQKKYYPFVEEIASMEDIFESLNINYYALISDNEGNIWAGTKGNGIIVFPKLEVINYTSSNSNLYENSINLIHSDKKNKLAIFHLNGRYSLLEENHITQKYLDQRLKRIRVVSKDLNGNYWLGGDGTITQIVDNDFNILETFNFGGIKDILLIDKNNTLFCSSNSTFKFKKEYYKLNGSNKKVKHRSKNNDVVFQERVYSLFQDREIIWIGSSKGIYKYKDEEPLPFLESGEHISYSVFEITQSKDSTLWFSTQAHGVVGIKNDSVIYRLDENSGLATNNCNNLFYDEYNNLWIGSKKGLHKLNLNTFEIDIINKYDGMPTDEISAIYARDSIVWIGTQKGLVKIHYSAIQKNKISPPIHITNVAFWEKDTTLFSSYDLEYNQNNINIEFVGITYRNRGNTKYQYRMIGVDTNWINTTTRFARYPLLNPGDYEFQVKAINEDGVESISPAKIELTINRPWWQMWWFYLLIFIGMVAFIGTFFYRRFQRIYKEEKKQKEFDEKINELRMMALQAQMNPHFVFNALSAIQKFLTTDEQEQAMIYLARFAQLIRNIFEHSKEKFITLDEEFEFLNLYLDLEKLRFKDKVNIKFNIDKSISEDDYDLQLPPLLIQPIIENAFKHGLMHKEEEGELKIDFSKDDEFLFCQIKDNGVGRKLAKEMGEGKLREQKPSGLKTAKERLAILNQSTLKLKGFNDLVIQDMKDESQNPIGTRVTLKIKYNNYSK